MAAETDAPNAYGALEAAMVHFAKRVARSQAVKRVRCNVVSPGTVYIEDGLWGRVKTDSPDHFEQPIAKPYRKNGQRTGDCGRCDLPGEPSIFLPTGANLFVDRAISHRVNF